MLSTVKATNSPKQSRRRQKSALAIPLAGNQRVTLACRLDRSADALLFLGCHVAAERLAMRAQALRETGR